MKERAASTPSETTGVGLIGIHHDSVVVTDPDKAREFYGQCLGLQEVPYPSTFDFPVIWYRLGDEQIYLMIRETADSDTPRHVALHVRDAIEARRSLRSRGVSIEETVRIPGADRFFVTDPDGNRIEMIEWTTPWGEGET